MRHKKEPVMGTIVPIRKLTRITSKLLIVVMVIAQFGVARAGHRGGRNSAVGGISIDVSGVVGPPSRDGLKRHLAALNKEIKAASDDMVMPVKMRILSLRGLAASCEDAMKNRFGRLPDEVQFLAGLQRIQYVFVDPEANDILIAGPAEGWRIDDRANVVGVTTDRPVLLLDDLLVALRQVHAARTEGISCSIDPTEEGYRNLQKVLDAQRSQGSVNRQVLEPAMKRAFGPQVVTIKGVPATSHFARVLVAADYRMKRIAMKIDQAPVKGLPSYLDLMKTSRSGGDVNPRWWLACNYEPLLAGEDGLSWELKGPGVKAMTEDDFVAADGTVTGTGRKSAAAQRWADMMTEKYDDLSGGDVIFAELRNLMDLCVVAALIEKNHLWDKAGLSVPILTEQNSPLKLRKSNPAKLIPPEVSFLKKGKSWIVTASGGIQVESWQVADNVETSGELADLRQQAVTPRTTESIWWQ
jgi:hypothetical protein